MIYISHKMAEIREIADDITIMRDGTYVGTWEVKNISDDEIVRQMVGRELTNVYPPKEDTIKDDVILEVTADCGTITGIFELPETAEKFCMEKGSREKIQVFGEEVWQP